jgi:septal ring-binding cell division protein DamX
MLDPDWTPGGLEGDVTLAGRAHGEARHSTRPKATQYSRKAPLTAQDVSGSGVSRSHIRRPRNLAQMAQAAHHEIYMALVDKTTRPTIPSGCVLSPHARPPPRDRAATRPLHAPPASSSASPPRRLRPPPPRLLHAAPDHLLHVDMS